ncbi:MAG TPA: ATP-binding protein [Puia sp.]|nr:ATP-binding protein [Puia sp.]
MRTIFNGLSRIQRKIAWLLLFSITSLALVGWLIYSNKRDMREEAFWINHTYAVIEQIERIDSQVAEGESFSLRYGISGDDSLRPGMQQFHGLLEEDIARLKTLTKDNPSQQGSLHQLLDYTHQLGLFVDSLVYLGPEVVARVGADPSDKDWAVREASAYANERAGMRAAAMIHRMKYSLRSMMREERNLLNLRQSVSRNSELGSTYTLITGSLLAFLFIVIILLQLNRDILLRKRAEKRLLQSEMKYRMLIENAGAVIYSTNEQGYITFTSAQVLELTGYTSEELTGKHFSMLVEHSCLKEVTLHYQHQIDIGDKESTLSFKTITKNREIKWVEQFAVLLVKKGRPAGFQCIVRDISEKQRMKIELERSRAHYQQQLIEATREAQEAKGMQEQFLANMSHEIRTPMNGIQGMTNLLLETPLSEPQKEFVDIIKRSADNLLVIINDILDFSKIKAGKLTIEKIDFRLRDVLDNVKGIFNHRVKKKGLLLKVEIDAGIPPLLKGDPHRLNQVLINLIGNAIKFTERGSIHVRVSLQGRSAEQVGLLFTVADTGIGIPKDRIPEIFDNFSQGGLDISRKYGGTGLGLAICKQLLQLQGGNISLTSEEGKGAIFSFQIAYGNSQREEPGAVAVVATGMSDHSQLLAGRRFLVAEDNEVNQKLVEYVLTKAGGIVQLANNGEEAVNLLRQDASYDLIIMDLQMPEMDGYGATKIIRDDMQLQTPIIAMTATALIGEQVRCLDAGIDEYMTKPFDFKELYRTIDALVSEGGRGRVGVLNIGQAYDLGLLRQMDDRQYLWDRLNAFLSDTPIQIEEMRRAEGHYKRTRYWASRIQRGARVLRSQVLLDVLQRVISGCDKEEEVHELVQMVQVVYEGLEPLLQEEKEKIGFVLAPEGE